MTRDSRPHISELVALCDQCGEPLELDQCVTLGCPVYEASMGRFPTDEDVAADVARCGMYSHERDNSEEDAGAVPGKVVA